MFPFTPLRNPIGFGAVDSIVLILAIVLVGLAILGRGKLLPVLERLARKTGWCMVLLAIAPVVLRLALLAHHPVPTPDLYDEFGHLLVADTLAHGRLANPPHVMPQFFETFFVLQRPTYSSIYPIGNGLLMALGNFLFGLPWGGVLLGTAAVCSLCYWMLRAWVTPGWALVGGVLAVCLFGPMNQWTNNYWGGELSAAAGCMVCGSLPRLREQPGTRISVILGVGIALHLLTRPYETVFLVLSVGLFFTFGAVPWRQLLIAGLVILPAIGLTLLQNEQVTGEWTRLPYQLSMYQYGVPAPLTFQTALTPHVPLTREQDFDYRMQSNFHPGPETITSYFERLVFRARYYRFYFYAPMYLALFAFLVSIRSYRWLWPPLTCLLFALGVNFFPAFQFHYVAAVACLFILMSVAGLERIARWSYGESLARLILFLCVAQFGFWYAMHLIDAPVLAYDSWDSVNHAQPERRLEVRDDLAKLPGKLLVFVRYWPQHPFQDEWVYNGAEIDSQRVVWARDLGDTENQKLTAYYGDREVLLLEPDARPPSLGPYTPAEVPQVTEKDEKPPIKESKKPLLQLEQVK